MDVVASFPADAWAAEVVEPGDRALDAVAECPQASAVRLASLGDHGADATLPEQAAVRPDALLADRGYDHDPYVGTGIDGYSRDTFLSDLADKAEADIRGCLDAAASWVRLDFSLERLTLKLDPSRGVLKDFVALDNEVLGRFSADERSRIGVVQTAGEVCDRVLTAVGYIPVERLGTATTCSSPHGPTTRPPHAISPSPSSRLGCAARAWPRRRAHSSGGAVAFATARGSPGHRHPSGPGKFRCEPGAQVSESTQ